MLPPEAKQFDFNATVIANSILQLLLLLIVYIAFSDSYLLKTGSLIAVVLYWLLVALAYGRRDALSLLERQALRLGLGALLPFSVLIAWFLHAYLS